jgi:hypothetical protein
MGPTALTSAILFLTTRQIKRLIRANVEERLPAFEELKKLQRECPKPMTQRVRWLDD